jgi:hypothetical protein
MTKNKVLIEQVEALQNILLSVATGGGGEDKDYKQLRESLISNPLTSEKLPRFVRTCRDLSQFWTFIKPKFAKYEERRKYLWEEFGKLSEQLENSDKTPSKENIEHAIQKLGAEGVRDAWVKALSRRINDPAGAITSARTLLETVCKHIMDDSNIVYPNDADLPKLYRLCSESLSLAPSQHVELVFKQILGGCTAVVEGLGALRNKVGDAHGNGRKAVKPLARHAHLSVNLAGSMATFLLETWESKGKP